MNNEIKELKSEIEDLTIHLADMLEAVLYFAGVKEENLEKGVKAYIEALDEVFDEEEDSDMGYREMVEVIEYLKQKKPELFR
jgi:ABC-type enterochelin transport system substrate-binding protein